MNDPQNREEEIFDAALPLPAAERAAYLDRACAGGAALRQRVEILLQASGQNANPLDRPPVATAKTVLLSSAMTQLAEQPGQQIGRYKLREKIGEGGCGVVYVADQEEPVRRRVALKIIKLGMDTRQVVARFEAERQVLALMDHPNIAKVLDGGATETGRPYFVMELVRGIKITDYCDQNNLSTEERLKLFIQVCKAVQHAHQKGIIHRDIKPSNVLVTLHDGVPVPKVIDFGIAKATGEQRLTDKTIYTAFEQFLGTPAYMSPEQAEMSGLDIDTRSDIYSLGVLLYELLTGRTPFDPQTLLQAGIDQMRRIIREQEPARPSTCLSTLTQADLTTIASHRHAEPPKLLHAIRGDLDWIVMKLLEKDRTRRYETASGVAADVQRHLDNEPVVARPPNAFYQFQKILRRNQTAVKTFLIVFFFVFFTSMFDGIRKYYHAKHERDVSEIARNNEHLARQQAEAAAKESEAIAQFMIDIFQSPDPTRNGHSMTVAEMLDAAAKRLDTDLTNQPARRATLQATLGRTYDALGLYRQAIPLQERVRDYYLAVSGPEHPNTLRALRFLAYSYDMDGQWEKSLKMCEELLPLHRKVLGPENQETLQLMQDLSCYYENFHRWDEALKLQEEALAAARKVLGPEHQDTLRAMGNLANSYDQTGRRDEALKLREGVLELRRKTLGPERTDTLFAMDDLAYSYDEAGRRDEALKLREDLLALRRKVNGPEHPETIWAMHNLAISYDEAGRRDEALKLWEEVLELRRKTLGPEHPDTLYAMQDLANAYDQAGRRSHALKLRDELLAVRRKAAEQGSVDAMNNVAWELATSPNPSVRDGATAIYFAEKAAAATNRKSPMILDTLAAAYAQSGQFEMAIKVQKEAIAIQPANANKAGFISRLSLYESKTNYTQTGAK